MIKEIKENEFNEEIQKNHVSVVIIEKPQCPHCMKTLTGVQSLTDKYNGKVSFYRVNLLEANSLVQKYQIMAAPTVMFFKDGKLVKSRSGYTHPLIIDDILGGL